MKAISLWQPWASLIAEGVKKIETRLWSTSYRGRIAIYAEPMMVLSLPESFFKGAINGNGDIKSLPLGAVIAICDLVAGEQITEQYELGYPETLYGDYTPGMFAWYLENVRKFDQSVYTQGQRGLWNWYGTNEKINRNIESPGSSVRNSVSDRTSGVLHDHRNQPL